MATIPKGFKLVSRAASVEDDEEKETKKQQKASTIPKGFKRVAVGQQGEETLEERARRLGAVPGVALTPEQREQIQLNQPIAAQQPTLPREEAFQPVPATSEEVAQQPLLRAAQQGLQNIGSGILRGFGELRQLVGDEEANQFLNDLSASTSIEQQRTGEITEGAPIQRFVGEVLGETAALPFGGAGKSLVSRLLSSGAAGAVGGGLSAAGRGLEGDEIQREALISAGLGAGTQLIGEGIEAGARRFVEGREQRRLAAELGLPADTAAFNRALREVQEGQEVAERTFPLLPAQKTLDPFQKQETAFLGDNPEVSTKAFDVLTTQNENASRALGDLLNEISIPEVSEKASAQARRAGTNIINSAKLIRQEKTSPIYNNAFRSARQTGKKVNVNPTLNLIDRRLREFTEAGQVSRELNKAKNILSDEKISDLKVAHNAKMEIDEIIRQGLDKNSLSDVAVRELEGVEKSLVRQMEKLEVGYREAREEFRDLSPAIDDLRDGIFGQLSRLSDSRLQRANSILFNPDETDPAVMRNAIKTLKGVDGGAQLARGLLRVQIQQRINKQRALTPGKGGVASVENLPGNINKALFGNPGQREVLFAALKELSPQAFENAQWLEKGLSRAAQARPGGSQTGIRNVITQKRRGITNAIRNFFTRPRELALDIALEQRENAQIRAIGDALYDPEWAPDMAKIRKLAPQGPEAATEFEKLLRKILTFNEKTGAITTTERIAAQVDPQEFENEGDQ